MYVVKIKAIINFVGCSLVRLGACHTITNIVLNTSM